MGFIEINYPLPGEPPAVYKKWYFSRFGYSPSGEEIAQFRRFEGVVLQTLSLLGPALVELSDITITENLRTFRPISSLNFILSRRN